MRNAQRQCAVCASRADGTTVTARIAAVQSLSDLIVLLASLVPHLDSLPENGSASLATTDSEERCATPHQTWAAACFVQFVEIGLARHVATAWLSLLSETQYRRLVLPFLTHPRARALAAFALTFHLCRDTTVNAAVAFPSSASSSSSSSSPSSSSSASSASSSALTFTTSSSTSIRLTATQIAQQSSLLRMLADCAEDGGFARLIRERGTATETRCLVVAEQEYHDPYRYQSQCRDEDLLRMLLSVPERCAQLVARLRASSRTTHLVSLLS
eukprot:CAMPEP_0177660556 /NCGR_PEP_ID=MMETSP0447-20121125/18111_1 /TAXON_ID=0 /ORGANISM="Stygamoeba regulata, Strain BSH-02190019" /LENGTH=271 /DNA_ID=CAMNT_0019165645 /DNA_START=81 /DNA_END=893 /DNA_ORIENTATION=+